MGILLHDDNPPARNTQRDCVNIIELPAVSYTRYGFPTGGFSNSYIPENLQAYTSRETLVMYLSTYHWKKIVNGYSGYIPHSYLRIMTEMQSFPSPRSVGLLAGLGVDHVIWYHEWLDEGERDTYEKLLASQPGISLEQDFGNQQVLKVHPVQTAGTGELDLRFLHPSAVPDDEQLTMCMLATNPPANPFVAAVEDWQPFRVIITDRGKVLERTGAFRVPLYLAPGESTSIPLVVSKPLPYGDYHLELILERGTFTPRKFETDISIRSREEMVGSGVLRGRLLVEGEGTVKIPQPDGLYPLLLRAENSGSNYWSSAWNWEHVTDTPYGQVLVVTEWWENGQRLKGNDLGNIPCHSALKTGHESALENRPT